MLLKCKDWKRFCLKQRLSKCPNGQVTTLFARSPKTRNFKKGQRVDQERFFKNRPKSSPRLKGKKRTGANSIILYFGCVKSAKTGEDLGAKSGLKRARMAKLWQFSEGHPKPAFSEKEQRGDQEKLLKNRPKRTPRFKKPRALWRKCHYPLICIH